MPDTGAQGLTPGGGIPTPNWDALADIDAVGGVTRADVVPRILDRLSTEALNPDLECKWFPNLTYSVVLLLAKEFQVMYQAFGFSYVVIVLRKLESDIDL